MAIYTTPRAVQHIQSNYGLRSALISDPAADDTDNASTCVDIIDVLQKYGMVATA